VISDRSNRREACPREDEMREGYRQRNRVERTFDEAEWFRLCATRPEILKDVDPGAARFVFGFIRVRKHTESVNTPISLSNQPLQQRMALNHHTRMRRDG